MNMNQFSNKKCPCSTPTQLNGLSNDEHYFFKKIHSLLVFPKGKLTKRQLEKIAIENNIQDKNLIKEITELAITIISRGLANSLPPVIKRRFGLIVKLYEQQVNLSHRTSQSILLQQYSTPAPIAYIAGVYADLPHAKKIFEPSAGNGLLTIAAKPYHVWVNEVDQVRLKHLSMQGFAKVSNLDASEEFTDYQKSFDAVITNPPFGSLDYSIEFDGFKIKTLDHLMAIRALSCMKDEGKASIIIGSHTKWDSKGRIQAGKNRIFFSYLYKHYYVDDVINLSGKKLYSRMGTSFDVRLILIGGRKQSPGGYAPLKDQYDTVVYSFSELFDRVMNAYKASARAWQRTIKEWLELRKQVDSLVPPKYGDWSKRMKEYTQEHYEIIQNAINDDNPIPLEVQKDYPDLFITSEIIAKEIQHFKKSIR